MASAKGKVQEPKGESSETSQSGGSKPSSTTTPQKATSNSTPSKGAPQQTPKKPQEPPAKGKSTPTKGAGKASSSDKSAVTPKEGKKSHLLAWLLVGAATSAVLAGGGFLVSPAMEDLNVHDVFQRFNLSSFGYDSLSMEALSANFKAMTAQLPAFNFGGSGNDTESRPGLVMARKGYKAKHPVIIVPGFVTSGLELWEGRPCAKKYFRQRMWGTMTMMQTFLMDAQCWFQHMELDPVTGLDPEGIKIRAAMGLEAVDYFVQGYWLWGKLVEALADIGYDSNNLVSMAYDWRLALPLMEARDGYFTRLRDTTETLVELSKQKVVIASHSYGENVVRAFMVWVERTSPGWVEENLESHVSIAGVTLGCPKAVSALLSGETKDTAQLGALAGYMTSTLVPRAVRTRIWRSWGSGYAMLPVGGTAVWGNDTWAPDDTDEMRAEGRTFGSMMNVWPHDWQETILNKAHADAAASVAAAEAAAKANESAGEGEAAAANKTTIERIRSWLSFSNSSSPASVMDSDKIQRFNVSGFIEILREAAGKTVQQHMDTWMAVDIPSGDSDQQEVEVEKEVSGASKQSRDGTHVIGGARHLRDAAKNPVLFPDATVTVMPNAPSFKWVCLYGVGKPTERAFHYIRPPPPAAETGTGNSDPPQGGSQTCSNSDDDKGTCENSLQGGNGTSSSNSGSCGCGKSKDECTCGKGDSGKGSCGCGKSGKECTCGNSQGNSKGNSGGCGCGKSSCTCGGKGGATNDTNAANNKGDAIKGEDSLGNSSSYEWLLHRDVVQQDKQLDVGVMLSDGDTTVPLVSLGLMCRKGWHSKKLNPGQFRIVTREFKHSQTGSLSDTRGGPNTGDHVDILGNNNMLMDVLAVAAGRTDELQDEIVSDIDRIAANINIFD